MPIACAADRAWYMNTWDNFMIPKPFAKIVIGIGEPLDVPAATYRDEIKAVRDNMQAAIDSLNQRCKAAAVEAT